MTHNSKIIKEIFNKIAEDYDKNNDLISLGIHKLIKKNCVKYFHFCKDAKVIDLCCGTGDIARLIQEQSPSAQITGVDFSENMLKVAKEKSHGITYTLADCTNLPFNDNSFDFCFMTFGLRNIQDKQKAIQEVYRICKPNGYFLHLDFGKSNFLCNFVFTTIVLTTIKLFYKDITPYKYLLDSKSKFPPAKKLFQLFASQGFEKITEKSFLFNIISAQIVRKPLKEKAALKTAKT